MQSTNGASPMFVGSQWFVRTSEIGCTQFRHHFLQPRIAWPSTPPIYSMPMRGNTMNHPEQNATSPYSFLILWRAPGQEH